MLPLLCAGLLLVPMAAAAQWDPQRIAELKSAAEAAYAQESFAEAARHYISLRALLKDALHEGTVPDAYRPSAEQALLSLTYQLGRANQQSANCQGAVAVYRDLVSDPKIDPSLLGKSQHRLGESLLCLSEQALAEHAIEAATIHWQEGLRLAEQLVAPTQPGDDDGLQADAMALQKRAQVDLPREIAVRHLRSAETAMAERRCDQAEVHLVTVEELVGAQVAAEIGLGQTSQNYIRACIPAEAPLSTPSLPQPVDDDPAIVPPPPPPPPPSSGTAWLPWTIAGLGIATLAGAVTADIIVADQVERYDAQRRACLDGSDADCVTARARYDEISWRPDLVLGLYAAGGAITLGGVIWLLLHYTASDPAAESLSGFTLTPHRHGLLPTLHWTF